MLAVARIGRTRVAGIGTTNFVHQRSGPGGNYPSILSRWGWPASPRPVSRHCSHLVWRKLDQPDSVVRRLSTADPSSVHRRFLPFARLSDHRPHDPIALIRRHAMRRLTPDRDRESTQNLLHLHSLPFLIDYLLQELIHCPRRLAKTNEKHKCPCSGVKRRNYQILDHT